MTESEFAKKLDDIEAAQVLLTKRAERAEAIIKLSADERSCFDTLSVEKQDAYLAETDVEKRKAYCPLPEDKVKKDDDEEGEEEGSDEEVVSDAVEKRFVELQKRVEAAETRAQAAEAVAKREMDARLTVEFSKRAESILPNLPGTAEEKGVILKTLGSKLSKDEVEAVEKLLLAGNAAMTQTFKPSGSDLAKNGTMVGGGSTWEVIEKKADALIAKGEKLTKAQAVDRVILTEPKLYDEYLREQKQK